MPCSGNEVICTYWRSCAGFGGVPLCVRACVRLFLGGCGGACLYGGLGVGLGGSICAGMYGSMLGMLPACVLYGTCVLVAMICGWLAQLINSLCYDMLPLSVPSSDEWFAASIKNYMLDGNVPGNNRSGWSALRLAGKMRTLHGSLPRLTTM